MAKPKARTPATAKPNGAQPPASDEATSKAREPFDWQTKLEGELARLKEQRAKFETYAQQQLAYLSGRIEQVDELLKALVPKVNPDAAKAPEPAPPAADAPTPEVVP